MNHITEEKNMAKCPKCGTEVAKPKKTWKMAGRPDKTGKRMQLEIGLYECTKCGNTFREVLSKNKV
ncbi:MAG: chromatin protein Cren7 [Candidatus Bathyarchaeia archaeon]